MIGRLKTFWKRFFVKPEKCNLCQAFLKDEPNVIRYKALDEGTQELNTYEMRVCDDCAENLEMLNGQK